MDNSFVSFATKTPANDRMKDLIASTWQGMRSGYSPTLCEAGVGGTYFMKDSHNKRIGVFKPNDEEMGCLNNPKVNIFFSPNLWSISFSMYMLSVFPYFAVYYLFIIYYFLCYFGCGGFPLFY